MIIYVNTRRPIGALEQRTKKYVYKKTNTVGENNNIINKIPTIVLEILRRIHIIIRTVCVGLFSKHLGGDVIIIKIPALFSVSFYISVTFSVCRCFCAHAV